MNLKFFILFSLLSIFSSIGHSMSDSKTPNNIVKNNGSIDIKVDQTGYHPNEIKIAKDADFVTLKVTRTTDNTCAKELIYGTPEISTDLPLNQAIDIKINVSKVSKLSFGCHMNKMFKGVIFKNE